MVKKWITMIILSAVLIFGCVFETMFVNKAFEKLINSLESLQIELSENKDKIDTEHLIEKTDTIHKEWRENSKALKCLIWHSGIKDIEIGMARIFVYVKENDYTEAYAEIAAIIDYCAHYLDDFSISSENIL